MRRVLLYNPTSARKGASTGGENLEQDAAVDTKALHMNEAYHWHVEVLMEECELLSETAMRVPGTVGKEEHRTK